MSSLENRRLRFKKRFYSGVLSGAGGEEIGKGFEQDGVKRRRSAAAASESRHPNLVAEQDVIQQSLDAAEGAGADSAVLGGFRSWSSAHAT